MTRIGQIKSMVLAWAAIGAAALLAVVHQPATADVRLPSAFTSHMVLQRDQVNPVWGWADAGEKVSVSIGKQQQLATADAQGKWRVKLAAMPAGGPHKMVVKGKNQVTLDDVLVGEVWVCSGQSNMQFSVDGALDADLTRLTAKYPQIRLLSVPRVGTQEPQDDFEGQWEICTPESVGRFSAVGYFFGRELHLVTGLPIGLIHDSWGGSSCEAWVPRPLLEADPQYKPLIDRWVKIEKNTDPKNKRNLAGQHRPGNLYNGMLKPIIGYGIRGAIWYQGESNAARAYQYRQLFPLMINSWRQAWGQGDFPFYWVQLADFLAEPKEPGESNWAELREAQTMTLQLPNTGQAVIIDLGEGNNIHPKNKEDVGRRLARWALGCVYGVDIVYRSPEYKSMERKGNKIVVTFQHVGGQLRPFDVNEVRGFTVAGKDKKFVTAQAKVVGQDKVEVWSDAVKEPAAVRYAWANNPVCNLRSTSGLPVTPFRTDDWPGMTMENR